jgi:RWP-RK domain
MEDLVDAFTHGSNMEGWIDCIEDKENEGPPPPPPPLPSPPDPLAHLRHFFHLPLRVAAAEIGIGCTQLKIECRLRGLAHWPYRTIKSLFRVGRRELAEELIRVGPPFDLPIAVTKAMRAKKMRLKRRLTFL